MLADHILTPQFPHISADIMRGSVKVTPCLGTSPPPNYSWQEGSLSLLTPHSSAPAENANQPRVLSSPLLSSPNLHQAGDIWGNCSVICTVFLSLCLSLCLTVSVKFPRKWQDFLCFVKTGSDILRSVFNGERVVWDVEVGGAKPINGFVISLYLIYGSTGCRRG